MPILEEIFETKKMLVVYDFEDTPEGNRDRGIFQRQITSKPYYGVQKTASCYLVLYSVANLDKVRRWGRKSHADIVVFGDVQTSVRDNKKLSKLYYNHLEAITKEVFTIAKRLKDELIDFEEDYKNPERTLRGWATKITGVTGRYEELKKLIDKVGSKDGLDEFKIEVLAVYVRELDKRYNKVKELKVNLPKPTKSKK